MNPTQEEKGKAQIIKLLQEAHDEEQKSNWGRAIEILKAGAQLALDYNLKEDLGHIYYRLGRNYHLGGDSAKTKELVTENYQNAFNNYKKANQIFKELKIEERIEASAGFLDLLTYLFNLGVGKEINVLESAKDHFSKAKSLYQQSGNSLSALKMEIIETRTLTLLIGELIVRSEENTDFKKVITEFDDLIVKIIEKLKEKPKISDYYLHRFLVCMGYCFHWIGTYVSNDIIDIKEQLTTYLTRHKEIVDIIDSSEEYSNYIEGRFYAYVIFASFSLIMGAYYAETQFEIKKLYQNARNWHKKAEGLLSTAQFNTSKSTFHILRFSISLAMVILGYSSTDFKHTLQILTEAINTMTLFYPKPMAAHMIVASCVAFGVGSLNENSLELTRFMLAEHILQIMEFGEKEIPMFEDPNYKNYVFVKDIELCTGLTVLSDLSEDIKERSEYLKRSTKLFEKLSAFSKQEPINNQANFLFCYFSSMMGRILAKSAPTLSEKRKYYELSINLLERAIEMPFNFHLYDNLFFLGQMYQDLGILLNDEAILKKSYLAYTNATEFCKKRGFYNLVGSGYVCLAQLDDRLGNFTSAAKNYQNAIDSFDQALLMFTFTNLGKKIEKTKSYLMAWKLIEIAKSYHANEDHTHARENYEEASEILYKLREFRFESSFYKAWSHLENAEALSKENKHDLAAEVYLSAKTLFQEAVDAFTKNLKKASSPDEKDRISNLIKVARIREQYCTARENIEKARLESIKGNNILSAELYNKSSVIFENICDVYRIKREKDELTATYFLCKAWMNMAKAEIEQKPTLYATAAELFEKAGTIFTKSRMKKLSSGNSLYCSALECGSLFDKSNNLDEKLNYYQKIKMNLRASAKNYKLGGFLQDAEWALATSTLFDGIWQLNQADTEIDFVKKEQYLSIAKKYLETALKMFEGAGYEQKKEEIANYLEMIATEKAILTSALDIIEKPAISESSIGIMAPSCPIEISSSLKIEEMQKDDLQGESELNWFKRMHHLYLFLEGGICIFDHPFQAQKSPDAFISACLVTGGLEGISMMIKEVTKKDTKVKIVEQEDITILFEHGDYVSGALITDENLMTLKTKLKQLVTDLEDKYKNQFKDFLGDITQFTEIPHIVQKIFEVPA